MKKVMISQLCRFYHGEKESPYLGDTSILWSTEKSFADAIIKNNKRVSFSEFHDHIIKAIRNRLPSDKERLLALYDGRYTEINQVVDKVWGEADKASQRQLSEIYAAIYGMDPEGKMEFIEKAMNNLRFDEDSFALKGYEDQNHWGYEGVSWVLKEATADYYWRNQDRLGDDLSDWILKDSLSFFLAMMMRDGLTKFRMEITHGEAAPLKTELSPEASNFLKDINIQAVFNDAIKKEWMKKDNERYSFLFTNDYERLMMFALLYRLYSKRDRVNWRIYKEIFGEDTKDAAKKWSQVRNKEYFPPLHDQIIDLIKLPYSNTDIDVILGSKVENNQNRQHLK